MANYNKLGKDDMVQTGNRKVRKSAIEIDGTDGPGVCNPNLLFRLYNENNRGLTPDPKNKTFREALAEHRKITGELTHLEMIIHDSKVQDNENKVVMWHQMLANKIQQKEGKTQCNDLQKAFNQ